MENENKRPIVYVAREITHFGEENVEYTIGYYVAKAYLNFAGKSYNKDGTVTRRYEVHFVNRFEMLDIKNREFYTIIADCGESRAEAFKDYASCKKYVAELNQKFAQTVGTTSASKIAKRMELHKQALEYGAALEDKYIPLEEREKINENINNY